MNKCLFAAKWVIAAICFSINFNAAGEKLSRPTFQVDSLRNPQALRKLPRSNSAWAHESKGSTMAVAVKRQGQVTNYWVKPVSSGGRLGFRMRSTSGLSGLRDLKPHEFKSLTRELRSLPKNQTRQCKDFVIASMVTSSGKIIRRVGCLNHRNSQSTLAYHRFAQRLSHVL